ncbi:MAG TPA: TonB family protein [Vicinamibacterales bacterium]|nr:TonB family protein [Vicinamibacterales bacterium]
MATTTQRGQQRQPAPTSSSLSLRPDDPITVLGVFEQPTNRVRSMMGAGLVMHAVAIGLLLLIAALLPKRAYQAILPDQLSDKIIWLSDPGPGGGGGGGNKLPDPPKKAEVKTEKPQKISVPTQPKPTPEIKKEPPPVEALNIPAVPLAAAPVTSPGAIESKTESASTGSGTGSGAGPGTGSGLGPGFGGGIGGGAYRPGNGVNLPQPVKEVKPQYTADAMRAKVQGTVLLECVVLPSGEVGSVEIVRSLDSTFGLDQEAIKAAKQWRFKPGTRFGEPVAVLVTIELTFTLR